MKQNLLARTWKPAVASLVAFALGAGSMAQFGGGIGQLIKVVGVGAAVSKFGPQINAQINKVAHTKDEPGSVSKVVPILSGGLNSRKAVGAAQVRGVKSAVAKVNAVAQLNQDILGELKLTVYVPISSKDVIKNLKAVPGVGVTGVVDLSVHL